MQKHYIREWRTHRGLTQKAMAEAMNISQSYVAMVERGTRRYDQYFLEGAAATLEVGIADLFRSPDESGSIDALLLSLDESERIRVEAVVRAMLGPK